MGKLTDYINKASPDRLLEIAEDLLKIECEYCDSEKEDVKDARAALQDYISSIRVELQAYGFIAGAGAIIGWKAILKKIFKLGLARMIAIFLAAEGLAIWWLYRVWKEITLRVREFREALHRLDDCLEEHNCH